MGCYISITDPAGMETIKTARKSPKPKIETRIQENSQMAIDEDKVRSALGEVKNIHRRIKQGSFKEDLGQQWCFISTE